MANQYLFYISQNYSFEILRPLQAEIMARGDDCAWFVEGDKVSLGNFKSIELILSSIDEVNKYNPLAVFVPGNLVPSFIPGLKVQVFHGLEWKKKGHFRIRSCFDLYCTHGNITTKRFNKLAQIHGSFHVKETGWPKLDTLFSTPPIALETDLPVILFAPTFSPNLTCALECLAEIERIAANKKYYWIVKFHPKMKQEWIELYREIESDNFKIIDTDSCLPLLQRADILLSDTSSIIAEFLLLNKPAVTFKNSKPGKYLIDIRATDELEQSIEKALLSSSDIIESIKRENSEIHPYNDGQSSQRILKAVDDILEKPAVLPKKKPLNIIRNFKLRKRLKYWKI
jgi:CDP-glycerol glycerophosphotransferase (TagB/SpsB family)